jgi:hypothetical protein
MGRVRNRPNGRCARPTERADTQVVMQVLCPRCEDDERDGYSMCTRCGQHFPLVKLSEEPTPLPIRVQAPCDECDRETFFGQQECRSCGRTLRRHDPVAYR